MNCKIENPLKQKSKLVRLVQSFNPVPILNARVRYDGDHNQWALWEDNKAKQHFQMGVMSDVKFSHELMTFRSGCDGRQGDSHRNIGFAQGNLRLHKQH